MRRRVHARVESMSSVCRVSTALLQSMLPTDWHSLTVLADSARRLNAKRGTLMDDHILTDDYYTSCSGCVSRLASDQVWQVSQQTNLGNQGSHGIVPQIQPLHDASSNGQHVFEGAADLHASHICGGVDSHVGAGKQLLNLPCQLGILHKPDSHVTLQISTNHSTGTRR